MKFVPAHLVSRTRQGLCGIALAASLSTAAVGGPLTAGASEADAGSQGSRPRGVPNLSLPDLRKSSGGDAPSSEVTGIPATALDAYKKAARAVATSQPGCHLPWELVAGIGRIESVHASGYGLRGDGSTAKPIRGPRLDGKQFALIRDTDGGRWDGDTEYDRAIGPTQFIPSTWATWGADGNSDGVKDPNNIYDAALGTGRYLCAGDRNLADAGDLDKAVLSYNNSREYVNAVLDWMHTYEGGKATVIPDDTPAAPYRTDPAVGANIASRATRASVSMGTASIRGPGGPTTTPPATAKKPGPGGVTKPKPDNQPDPKPGPRTVRHLDPVGEQVVQADTGQALDRRFQVRATDAVDKAVARKGITYEIVGDALARFPNGAKSVTVATDAQGIAVAPQLLTGAKPGSFIIKASTPGEPARAVEFRVTLRLSPTATADTLKLVNEQPLRATGGGSFSGAVRVKATRYGQPAVGTSISATVIRSKNNPAESTVGPYFTGADSGTPVRSLTLPPPGTDGVVTLPEIHTDPNSGTYILRLTAPEGVTLDIELTVEAPPAGS
ncbi:lytic transglycosylase domain-containing protein [Streptomyces syringium]|uniref:lytic transglycosylase domain-containing protein n=1 Tax=Streptomyces syringium TaxID=76729 RepID=UPI003D93C598